MARIRSASSISAARAGGLAEPDVAGIGRAGVVDRSWQRNDGDHRQAGSPRRRRAARRAPSSVQPPPPRGSAAAARPRRAARSASSTSRRRGRGRAGCARGGTGARRPSSVQHVLGQRDAPPAPAGRQRGGEGAGDDLGDAVGVVDLGRPLGQRRRRRRGSRPPGTPRARASSRPTWPTNRTIGVRVLHARCARRSRRWWRPGRG